MDPSFLSLEQVNTSDISPTEPQASAPRRRRGAPDSGPRRVLITGATRGIGRAIAERIARDGYEVVITGRKPSLAADETLEALKSSGAKAHALFFDVADRAAALEALEGFTAEHGPFWGVILNAGINRDGPLAGMNGDEWDQVLNTDLGSFYNVLKPLVLPMARSRAGRIIVMSSVSGIAGTRGQTNYSAAKAGLIGLTKALAKEEGPSGITVNCVAPGVIDTDMMASFTAEDKAALAEETPVGRLGTAEEVAKLLLYLAGEDAGYITGQVFGVNGGLVI